MNNKNCLINALRIIGLLTLLISMSACGASTVKWKEEVQLSDNKVIVVERDAIYEAGGDEWAFNRSGSKIKGEVIRFTLPDGSGKTIEWHSTKISPRTYPEVPLVLDIVSGQSIVFSLVAISIGCEVYSKYVYQNGVWIEEPLPEKFEQHTTNLLFASQKDLPKLLDLAEKNRRNDEIGHRKALRQIGPNRKACG